MPTLAPAGRLLLVAPNVAHIERELDVDPHDFRLWVCLHEETHRVQFTAVPWLRDHLRGQIRSFLEQTDLDPGAMFSQFRQGFEQLGRIARGGGDEVSFIDLVQTPEQREIIDRVTAVMSLLEGHADVVMDGVGPEVIPSVNTIRDRFQQRRGSGNWLDQFLKRVLGLDAKLGNTVTARPSSAPWSRRWARTGSTRCGRHPTTCPPGRRSPTRPPGYAGSTPPDLPARRAVP